MAEGTKLGLETVLRLAEARERVRQRAVESGIRSPTFADVEDFEVEGLIREVFGIASRPTSPTIPGPPAKGTHSRGASINGYSSFTASGNGFASSAPAATNGSNGHSSFTASSNASSAPAATNGSAAKSLADAVTEKLSVSVNTPPVAMSGPASELAATEALNQRPSSPGPKSASGAKGATTGEPSTAVISASTFF